MKKLLCLSCWFIYFILFFYPKKYSIFCLGEQCITIVIEYKQTIWGWDKSISLYSGKIFYRLQLAYIDYMKFPIEMDVLIHKKLLDDKFVIVSQVLPIYTRGNINDYFKLKLINYYTEEDGCNISLFSLDYKNIY